MLTYQISISLTLVLSYCWRKNTFFSFQGKIPISCLNQFIVFNINPFQICSVAALCFLIDHLYFCGWNFCSFFSLLPFIRAPYSDILCMIFSFSELRYIFDLSDIHLHPWPLTSLCHNDSSSQEWKGALLTHLPPQHPRSRAIPLTEILRITK